MCRSVSDGSNLARVGALLRFAGVWRLQRREGERPGFDRDIGISTPLHPGSGPRVTLDSMLHTSCGLNSFVNRVGKVVAALLTV